MPDVAPKGCTVDHFISWRPSKQSLLHYIPLDGILQIPIPSSLGMLGTKPDY